MVTKLCLIVSIACVVTVAGQWSQSLGFNDGMNGGMNQLHNTDQLNYNMQNMNHFQNNMQNMRLNLNAMGQRMNTNVQDMSINLESLGQKMASRREARFEQNFLLAQNGVDFGLNGKIFEPVEGGLGFAYNSTDGAFTMYVISTGSPPRGFMHHFGMNGNQMYNSW